MSGKKGISALISNIIMLIAVVSLVSVASYVIYNSYRTGSQNIQIVDAYCKDGDVVATVRNLGTDDISNIDVYQTDTEADMAEMWVGTISPGSTGDYYDTCIGSEPRICKYQMRPSQGATARFTVSCAGEGYMTSYATCKSFEDDGLCCALDEIIQGYRENCVLEHGLCDVVCP